MEICVGREAIYNLPVLESDSETSNEEDNDLADTEDNSEEEDSFLIRLNPLQKSAQVIPPERAKYLARGYLVSSIHISKPDSDPQLKLQRVKAKRGHKRQLADCVETSGPQKMQGIEQVLEIHSDASQASITHVSDSEEGKEPITFSANPHQHCRVASPTLKHDSTEEQMNDEEMDSMSMGQRSSPVPSGQESPVPSDAAPPPARHEFDEPHAIFTTAFPAFVALNNKPRPPAISAFTPVDHRFGSLISRVAREITEDSDNAKALGPAILVTPAAGRLVPLHDRETGRTLEISLFYNARQINLRDGADPSVHIGTTLVVTIDGEIDAQFLPSLERTFAGLPSGRMCGLASRGPYFAPDGRLPKLIHNGGFLPLDFATGATIAETQSSSTEYQRGGLTSFETENVLKKFPSLKPPLSIAEYREPSTHEMAINFPHLDVRLTEIPAQDRLRVATLLEDLANLAAEIYARNGELEGLGVLQSVAAPRKNAVTFPLIAHLLLDNELFTLRSIRTGPVKPTEHQLAAHVLQLAAGDENDPIYRRNTFGLRDAHLIESRFLDNVASVDRQLFDIRNQFGELTLSEQAADHLARIPLCGPLLHALRESQEEMPHLETQPSTPEQEAAMGLDPAAFLRQPTPSEVSEIDSMKVEYDNETQRDMSLSEDEGFELQSREPLTPDFHTQPPTPAEFVDPTTGVFVSHRFIACPLEPINIEPLPEVLAAAPTYVIREACHSVNCVRKRENRVNPDSPRGLACGMVGHPFDGNHLTDSMSHIVPTRRVGVWRGPEVQDVSTMEDRHLLHPLSSNYYPTSATATAVDRAVPVYEMTRIAEKLASAMARPPRLFVDSPAEEITADQILINMRIRKAVEVFEEERQKGEHDLPFKDASFPPVTHFVVLGQPLETDAPDLAVQVRQPILDYDQFRIQVMRYQPNAYVEVGTGSNPDAGLTFFNLDNDTRAETLLSEWRGDSNLSRLRDARRYAARFVEYIVLLAQSIVFRSAVDVLPKDHPTHHYFYYHCHVLRYLRAGLRDADQGFNFICAHIDPMSEGLLSDAVINGFDYRPYNPLLTGDEDLMLQHSAIILEFCSVDSSPTSAARCVGFLPTLHSPSASFSFPGTSSRLTTTTMRAAFSRTF
ncbi:hypothetical protein CYLTODRAFT_460037 [Cylindrobasidium torrendii FP15055 ss-10]|uniref:Uncharacterized protein n=1 Tax=Cylindrobasidium torrendii FP15055 ss-10 TaxID=1314674 RepID=A0A0D7ATS4_9AGAR|nr:hypothetical protein CYLTODRAFT_460037 [Cylindrobasidium torrendii FP15055 ss-10]